MALSVRFPVFSFQLGIDAFFKACRRFPAAMACAAVFTGAFIRLIFEGEEDTQAVALMLGALMGLPLCIGLVALSEYLFWADWRKYAAHLLGLFLAAGCYFWLQPSRADWEEVQIPRFALLFLAAHLWTAAVPFFARGGSVEDFWEYNKRLMTHFVTGAVYGGVLFLGLTLALAAINALFDLHWSSRIYGYLFALLAGMFQTTFFLYHFPQKSRLNDAETGYPELLRNLCQYVFVPLVGLYFLILYAYSAKILLSWQLPRGWVSSLVLGFSVAGIFTYLITHRFPQYFESRWVSLFQKRFWWVLGPMTVLLLIAIGRRISDYGVTPERYLVAHTGVWLAVTCLYFLWPKGRDIRFIPLSLMLFIVPAVVGPISAFQVSQRSQRGILKSLFEKHRAFEEKGTLKRDLSYLPEEDRERIRSIVSFLSEQDALHLLADWLPEPLHVITPDSLSTFERSQVLLERLRLSQPSIRESLYVYTNAAVQPLTGGDIAGFRAFFWINVGETPPARVEKSPYFALSSNGNALIVGLNGIKSRQDTLDFRNYFAQWQTIAQTSDGTLPEHLSRLDWTIGRRQYRLFIREMWLSRDPSRIQQLNGVLFLK